ncbi:uncharacterized protein BKA78DRAFT_323283 [Phyllosticta capitalensis]|uniref:uncharacterized protein n=1 Tax=Phyllosticta capitalensis TaxID=121624 RepID=UPI00312DA4BC
MEDQGWGGRCWANPGWEDRQRGKHPQRPWRRRAGHLMGGQGSGGRCWEGREDRQSGRHPQHPWRHQADPCSGDRG